MSDELAQFANQKYFALETYRRNGKAVATPVWFAEEGGKFYVYTLADSGKVKRIRNNPRVRIAPCDVRGNVKGDWVEATARIANEEEAQHGNRLLDRKYWLKRVFNITSKLSGKKRAVIIIEPE